MSQNSNLNSTLLFCCDDYWPEFLGNWGRRQRRKEEPKNNQKKIVKLTRSYLCLHHFDKFSIWSDASNDYTVILTDWTQKERPLSNYAKTKGIFEIQQGILEACTNRTWSYRPFLINWQNGTFKAMYVISILVAIWLHLKHHESALYWFIQNMSQAPSKCLYQKINWIVSRFPCRISKNILV